MKLIGLIGIHNTGPGRMTLRAISGSDNAGKFIWHRALFIVIKAAFCFKKTSLKIINTDTKKKSIKPIFQGNLEFWRVWNLEFWRVRKEMFVLARNTISQMLVYGKNTGLRA